jgi:hypothetical protein
MRCRGDFWVKNGVQLYARIANVCKMWEWSQAPRAFATARPKKPAKTGGRIQRMRMARKDRDRYAGLAKANCDTEANG